MRYSMMRSCMVGVLAWGWGGLALAQAPEGQAKAPARSAAILEARAVGVGRLAPEIRGQTLAGSPFALADLKSPDATVIAMTSASCPITRKYAPVLARLEEQYRAKGVAFVFVNSGEADSLDEMKKHAGESGFGGPYLADRDGRLAAALGAETTAEVFVLDKARTIVYRGAIDDQYALGVSLDAPRHRYLTDALDATLAGRRPEVGATAAPGCVLGAHAEVKGEKSPPITYHNRISRIVQDNCVSCHRQDGLGPFKLDSYQAVASRAKMIGYVVERGDMPPWFAAPPAQGEASPWRNDRSLSEADRTDLLAWLASDRPEGDPTDAPLARTWPSEWTIGKPDYVVRIPEPIGVKAEGTMPYRHVRVETKLTEDKWVKAIEVLPTDRAVVHHVLVFVVPPGPDGELPKRPLSSLIDETRTYFAAYVPGGGTAIYPEGFAKLLPKGSLLIFQLHYTPNGKATTDQTRMGLIFADKPPAHEIKVIGIANNDISIPPGAPSHVETATLKVPQDAKLLAFMPHMHTRGKAMKYEAITPSGETTLLADVPRYDFNWQLRYELREPVEVYSGDTIKVTAVYDNSAENPANPDPKAQVRWGPQTTDEMMLGYVEYYHAAEDDDAETPAAPPPPKPGSGGLDGAGISKAGRRLLRMFDRNRNGQIERSECPPGLLKQFDAKDKNHDGVLAGDELN